MAIVVLANLYPQGHALAAALADTLCDLYLGVPSSQDRLAQETEALESPVPAEYRRLPEQPPAGARAPRSRAVYVGTYTQRYFGSISVSRGPGATLRVRFGRGETTTYLPWDGDTWRDAVSGTAAVFTVRGDRAVGVRVTALPFDGAAARFARR